MGNAAPQTNNPSGGGSIAAGSITNTEVSATAAIAGTKIAPAFGTQNITATGSLTLSGGRGNVDAFGGAFAGSITGGGVFSSSATSGLGLNPGGLVRWGQSVYYTGFDTGITRKAAGFVDINGGASGTKGGIFLTGYTTTEKNAISSPAAGMIVFDTTLGKLCVYAAGSWQTITSI